MLQERVIYLINADIDGELAPGEKNELEALLAGSEEARTMQSELRRLSALMDGLPQQEPPAWLEDRIVSGTQLPRISQAGSRRSRAIPAWLASFRPAQAGLAFAAGLLAAVGVYELTPRGDSAADISSMVGTMVANRDAQAAKTRDRLSITYPGLDGSVTLGQVGDFLVLNFELESVARTEVVVELAGAGLGFGGIAQAADQAGAGTQTYEFSGGTLRVVNQGRQAFSVFLPRLADDSFGPGTEGREISIGINTDGATPYRGVLRS